MSDFAPGAVIDGRYRVRSRVGAGGMADVYLAQDEQLGRQVAVKVLHRRFAADPGFVERFKREAQSAAVLQHPHVVSVFDRGEFDGTYYIAMEYLPGRSLKALIQAEAPLEPVRAIDITIQILQATGFAHRHGVIHRDLKPHNVIVDDDDNVKVTDFGIARAGASDMTETGSIMGTAQYLSPEQAQGHAVSGPSDLYSVGVILYEMLTGKVPFDGESPVAIALKHVSEAPVGPSQLNPSVSPDLEQVVLWALNKNPADRPADADQFSEVLEQVKSSPLDHTASMQAITSLAAAGAAASGVARAPGAGGRDALQDSDSPADAGPEDKAKRRKRLLIVGALVALVAAAAAAFLLTRPSKVVVPKVVGSTLAQAESALSNAGLKYSVATETSSETANTVIHQDPLAGVQVKKSSVVNLIVSSGATQSATVAVPQVVGLSQQRAEQAIKQAGLLLSSIESESSSAVAKGEATRTDPIAGTALARNSSVTLYISTGPKTTTSTTANQVRVPNLVTNQLATAQSTLANLNLSSSVIYTTSSATPGTVLSQSPRAGTKVAANSTVTLVVAQAVNSVPNVVGVGAAQATSTVRAAGYRVTLVYVAVSSAAQNGIVQKQSPKGNVAATLGTVVTLSIGQYSGTTTTTSTSSNASAAGDTTTNKSSSLRR